MNGTRKTTSAESRFWSKVDQSAGPDSCWPWMAGTTRAGYGVFHPRHGQTVGAHRWSLTASIGRPLGRAEFACHRCDNPGCVNPSHMFVGSHGENMRDMTEKGRSARGERKVTLARLKDWQVVAIRNEAGRGALIRDLAAKYGVTPSLVSMIIRGKRWTHLGGPITRRYSTKKEATRG